MILLSVVFIKFIPNMLNAGNEIGTIKNTFSDVLKLRFGREKILFLFSLYPIIANAMIAVLNEINSGIVDNGVSYPKLSDKLFNNNPKNIRKEMLSPTDNTNFSVDPILFNFSTCRINNPGIKVRKRNPRICLKSGMFKNMAKSVEISSATKNKKRPLASKFFVIYVPSFY